MNAHTNKAFYYHAHASSLGGSLRQPLERVISTNASASLASAGGFTTQRHDRFHLDGLISFQSAHVRVSGSEHVNHIRTSDTQQKEVRSWRTISSATIEGLNVLEVLTADRVVAQVSVDHPHDTREPVRIALLGSRFENLKVHGSPLHPRLDSKIFGHGRAAKTSDGFADTAPLQFSELMNVAVAQHKVRSQPKPGNKARALVRHGEPSQDLEEKGSAVCSLVEEVGHAQDSESAVPIESFSHILHIPDFGNVFLGEMLISRFSAQLNMLRVEMGCMADGDLSACSVFSNGRIMP